MARLRRAGYHRWGYELSDTGLVLNFELRGNLLFSRKRKYNRASWAQMEVILQRANEDMADTLQLLVVEELQKSLERPKHSTGRLERATLDERNRLVTPKTVQIGNPRFLDRSEAKYWRQIEEGYQGHVGRPIVGLWNTRGMSGKWSYHNPSRRGLDTFVTLGRLRQLRSSGAKLTIRGTGADGRRTSQMVDWNRLESRIKVPIRAHQYYAKAMQRFRAMPQYRINALRRAISEVLGVPMREIPRGYNQIKAWL